MPQEITVLPIRTLSIEQLFIVFSLEIDIAFLPDHQIILKLHFTIVKRIQIKNVRTHRIDKCNFVSNQRRQTSLKINIHR